MLRGSVGSEQSPGESQLLENKMTRAWCLQGLYQERRGWWFQDRPLVQESRRSSGDGQMFERLEISPEYSEHKQAGDKTRRGMGRARVVNTTRSDDGTAGAAAIDARVM